MKICANVVCDIGMTEQYKACCHFHYRQSCYPCHFMFSSKLDMFVLSTSFKFGRLASIPLNILSLSKKRRKRIFYFIIIHMHIYIYIYVYIYIYILLIFLVIALFYIIVPISTSLPTFYYKWNRKKL